MFGVPRVIFGLRALALTAVLALIGLVLAARNATVLERGRLLPFFDTYEVSRVRLLGVELYVDTSSGAQDLMTVLALAAVAVLLGLCALRLRGRPAGGVFMCAALGALWLAADDLLAVHETVGHNLPVLADLPLVDHPDDVIVGMYGVAAALFALRHRQLAAGTPLALWLAVGVLGAAAVGHDLLPLNFSALEEICEVGAGLGLLAAVVLIARRQLRADPPA